MINKKKGFSLAELLLCLMIIGVVSAMGITLTKHNVDKANNLYYYTGYINLYNALADILKEDPNFNLNSQNTMTRINSRIGTTPPDEYENNDPIITSNGIRYVWEADGSRIEMRVPQRKTRTNPSGLGIVEFRYFNDDNIGYLIPCTAPNQNGNGQIATDITPNLQERMDLLPAYVDNGTVGRVRGNQFNPIEFRSYREVFCSVRENRNAENWLNCNNNPPFQASEGVLKVANPRKL